MVGYTVNNRNRFKCKYCDHTTYKHATGVLTHIEQRHPLELERDKAIARAEYAEKAKVELSRQLAEATKPTPKKEEVKFWRVPGLYCSNCKSAQRGGGIPIGQTVEDTPHSTCGTRSLMLILELY